MLCFVDIAWFIAMGENDRKMQKTFIEERQWKTNLDFWLSQLEICKIVFVFVFVLTNK